MAAINRKRAAVPRQPVVCQFRIGLLGITPEIWRRILVPESYTFWDLHVAIQDGMGWLDYHLHQFELKGSGRSMKVGIPDEEYGEHIAPSWEVGISRYFTRPGQSARYDYDFGDDWNHEVLLEGVLLGDRRARYPTCVDGAGSCPPEDCGGVHGLEELNRILSNPRHKEYKAMTEWVEGQGRYRPYHPESFDVARVRFDNPKTRWKKGSPS